MGFRNCMAQAVGIVVPVDDNDAPVAGNTVRVDGNMVADVDDMVPGVYHN
jgi:hypothetical protein